MKNTSIYGLIYGIAIFTGFSYLIGFWIPFRFNFIEHIDLAAILKISAFSIIPVFVSLVIGAGIGGFASFSHIKGNLNSNLSISPTKSRFDKIFFWSVRTIVAATCLIFMPFLFSQVLIERLLGAYPIASIFSIIYLTKNPNILSSLPILARSVITTVACMLPTAAIFNGYLLGQDAFNNKSQGYLLAGTTHCSSNTTNKYRYLATSGERILTMSLEDQSICVTSEKAFRLIAYNTNLTGNSNSINYVIDRYKELPPIKYMH